MHVLNLSAFSEALAVCSAIITLVCGTSTENGAVLPSLELIGLGVLVVCHLRNKWVDHPDSVTTVSLCIASSDPGMHDASADPNQLFDNQANVWGPSARFTSYSLWGPVQGTGLHQ